jgi:pSer/pThr/pTyr-binding forkhead associated (FHA) protein
LEAGRFRVQHVWDTEAQKTMVKPRKRAEPAPADFVTVTEKIDDEATIVRARKPAEPLVPSFSIRVHRNVEGADSTNLDLRPFFKNEITIGRGSRHLAVDLRLEGDLEVSRLHATLVKEGDEYIVTCKGANPIVVNDGQEIAANQSAPMKPGDKITICSYELTLQI